MLKDFSIGILLILLTASLNVRAGETEQLQEGPFVSYDEKGQMAEEGLIKNGNRHGAWKLYIDGVLWCEKQMKDGVEDGLTKIYDKNGKIIKEIPYKDGKVHGVYRQYDEGGTWRTEIPFRNGEMHGKRRDYKDGRLYKTILYSHGKEITATKIK